MLGEAANENYTNKQKRMLENAWLQESKELQDLWLKNLSPRKMNSQEIEESIEYQKYDDYEDEEEEKPNSNIDETNEEKYHYKEKIEDFNEIEWNNLDDETQVVLNEHIDDILNAKNYQEQVQIAFSLIYSLAIVS